MTSTDPTEPMASTAAALPKWVMLERFVFRRDDPSRFREDKRTSASGTTCTGTRFDVSFILAEPPTPSRLYVSWPEVPKGEIRCHLVAAHRNLVLLRLDIPVDESIPFGEILDEYFIYVVDPTSQVTPLLRPLPQYTEYIDFIGRPYTRSFPTLAVGLMCHAGDEFVAAHLGVRWTPDFIGMQKKWVENAVVTSAQLCFANTHLSPLHEVMMIPLLSLDMPTVMHCVLFDWAVGSVSLAAIDLNDKKVKGSIVEYIKSMDDLSTDDADLVKTKPSYFGHFLPSEFPKFMTLRLDGRRRL